HRIDLVRGLPQSVVGVWGWQSNGMGQIAVIRGRFLRGASYSFQDGNEVPLVLRSRAGRNR
ncbi:MAG: hypothetical protein ACLQBU_14865, partial [Terriglobales bacterium]